MTSLTRNFKQNDCLIMKILLKRITRWATFFYAFFSTSFFHILYFRLKIVYHHVCVSNRTLRNRMYQMLIQKHLSNKRTTLRQPATDRNDLDKLAKTFKLRVPNRENTSFNSGRQNFVIGEPNFGGNVEH